MKSWMIALVLVLGLLMAVPTIYAQQQGAQGQQDQQATWNCPRMGQGMGPGRMMRHRGAGCPGWQNAANTTRPGCPYAAQAGANAAGQPAAKDQAKTPQ